MAHLSADPQLLGIFQNTEADAFTMLAAQWWVHTPICSVYNAHTEHIFLLFCCAFFLSRAFLFNSRQVWGQQVLLLFFFFFMNACVHLGCVTLIKSDSKYIYNVTKNYFCMYLSCDTDDWNNGC